MSLSLEQLLDELSRRRIQCWAEAGKLRIRAPEGAVDAEIKAALAAHKTALLERFSAPPTESVETAPLSFDQERLWWLQQLAPANAAYNERMTLRLSGALDRAVLERSINALVQRHASLRTVFRERDGRVEQAILPSLTLSLPTVDLRAAAEIHTKLEAIALESGEQPFDLATGPLLRAQLIILADQDHVLLLTAHHIIADGWSLASLIAPELLACYNATKLPPPSARYADFARWQRQYWTETTLATQRSYWQQQLAGAPPLLELPGDRPRPPVQSYRGGVERLALGTTLSEQVKALSRDTGATLFMILLAAYAMLLARYSRQRDLVIGAPATTRSRQEFESVIGCFVNTLALRVDLTGEITFRELVQRVRQTALAAYAHADLPFDKLVQALGLARDPAYTPLVQVIFTLHPPRQPLTAAGLTLSWLDLPKRSAKFDLLLAIDEFSDGFSATLEYASDLFDATTAARLLQHYRRLLEAVAANPDRCLSAYPLLSDAERHMLLYDWNATRTDYPLDRTVVDEFERQAARTPDAIAVVCENQSLSYAELNRRANRLAHHLIALGVAVENLVGLCMERSLELIIAVLGVLKAGAAYVPFDPSYPAERLAAMLDDANVAALLTQSGLLERLPLQHTRTICLDRDWPAIAQQSSANPTRRPLPLNLAYAIYTSGSTGQPKGVPNSHRGLLNRLLWMQDAYRLDAGDRVLQKTPYSFDVSVWELLWPLLTGARLVFAKPEGHKDSGYLAALIEQEKITTLHFVPPMLQVFLQEPRTAACRSLRRVICSGEALPPELQQRFFACLNAELHNLYGPTEAAIDVTAWSCRRAEDSNRVPIGRPVANTRTYVLDDALQPVPIGAPGELYLGGVQLARGYLHRPALTAERFVPDPVGTEPGARLYRTGDLARWRNDGVIDYLGRVDFQVKLRGFRIELGEIEATLAAHPGVQATVVVAAGDGQDRRLVAYLVAAEPVPTVAELQRYLRERLPEHMVPALFVFLPALPLNSNGKVDRKALPPPENQRSPSTPSVAPRTELERTIAGIWRDLLQLEQVSVHDNFFDVGGHSLLLASLLRRLQAELSVSINLFELLKYPTIHALAQFLEQASNQAATPQPADATGQQRAEQRSQRLTAVQQQRQRRQRSR